MPFNPNLKLLDVDPFQFLPCTCDSLVEVHLRQHTAFVDKGGIGQSDNPGEANMPNLLPPPCYVGRTHDEAYAAHVYRSMGARFRWAKDGKRLFQHWHPTRSGERIREVYVASYFAS